MATDFFSQLYSGTGLGDYLKTWNHASKIFVGSNYRLSPKYSFLFHIAFDLDPNLTRMDTTGILEAGMLVKTMQLPRYTIENKTYNAYNRKNIVQQAIKYDPVSVTFHDDSADVIRDLWYDYMSYYYRDTDYTPEQYLRNDKYDSRRNQAWGFTPSDQKTRLSAPLNNRLIQRIRLYSLHQKQFTEYVLINPVITGFQHGEHQQGQNETMQHTMTLQYETVLYNYGSVSSDAPAGFATLHYDSTPSPLGVPSLAGSVVNNLAPGLIGSSGALGGIISGLTGTAQKIPDTQLPGNRNPFNNNQGTSGVSALLSQIALGISKGNNPLQNLSVPTLAGYAQTLTGPGGLTGILGSTGITGFFSSSTSSSTGSGATSNGEQTAAASQFGAPAQNFPNIGSFNTSASNTQAPDNQGTAFGSAPQNFTNIGTFNGAGNTGTGTDTPPGQ